MIPTTVTVLAALKAQSASDQATWLAAALRRWRA